MSWLDGLEWLDFFTILEARKILITILKKVLGSAIQKKSNHSNHFNLDVLSKVKKAALFESP